MKDTKIIPSFTSRRIASGIEKKTGLKIPLPRSAVLEAKHLGCKDIIVLPVLMNRGKEFSKLKEDLDDFHHEVELLDPVVPESGKEEIRSLIRTVSLYAARKAGYPSLYQMMEDRAAVLLFGHGSLSEAKDFETVRKLAESFEENIFFAAYEADSGPLSLESAIRRMEEKRVRRVILLPFMVTAGKHVREDMAGENRSSWAAILRVSGFSSVIPVLTGLGRFPSFQRLLIDNLKKGLSHYKKVVRQPF